MVMVIVMIMATASATMGGQDTSVMLQSVISNVQITRCVLQTCVLAGAIHHHAT